MNDQTVRARRARTIQEA